MAPRKMQKYLNNLFSVFPWLQVGELRNSSLLYHIIFRGFSFRGLCPAQAQERYFWEQSSLFSGRSIEILGVTLVIKCRQPRRCFPRYKCIFCHASGHGHAMGRAWGRCHLGQFQKNGSPQCWKAKVELRMQIRGWSIPCSQD